MRDDFWQTPAGADATRMMQNHYADIILALKEYSFFLLETDKPRSDCLSELADKLFMSRVSGNGSAIDKTETER